MRLNRLWLADFRNYRELELEFAPGCTLVVGTNGQGKTNLVEAVAFLAVLDSFRGSPLDALVRDGADSAIVRGDIRHEERELLVEVEVPKQGRVRARQFRAPPGGPSRGLCEALAEGQLRQGPDLGALRRRPSPALILCHGGLLAPL